MKEASSKQNEKTAGWDFRKLRYTVKGLALLAAINVDLVPKINGDYDTERFDRFWEKLQEMGFLSYLQTGWRGKPWKRAKTAMPCVVFLSREGKPWKRDVPGVVIDCPIKGGFCAPNVNQVCRAGRGLRIAVRGIAYREAINVGLIPEINGKHDADLFNRFWTELYEIGVFTYLLSLGPDKLLSSKTMEKRDENLY